MEQIKDVPEETKDMAKEKPMLTFEGLLKDMKMDAVNFKEKYGCEKEDLKMLLDKMWLNKLSEFELESSDETEIYKDAFIKNFGKEIKEVELFEVGHHNGKTFTQDDIDKIYKSTLEVMNKENLQIPIKLGHSQEQGVAKKLFGEDSKGMPALGWVKNLKKKGEKIVGDLVDIPEKLYEMLEEKMWNTRSIELWEGFKTKTGETVGSVITGLALLGAEVPAVTDLATLFESDGETKVYSSEQTKKGDINMSEENKDVSVADEAVDTPIEEKVIEEPKAEPEKVEMAKETESEKIAKMREMKRKADEGDKAIKELKEYKRETAIKEDHNFLEGLAKEGKLLPFQKEMLKGILPEISDSEVSYFDKSIEEDIKGKSKDLIKEFLKSLPNQVEYQEFSKQIDKSNKDDLDVKAKEFAKQNKVSIEDAYKHVARESNIDLNTL